MSSTSWFRSISNIFALVTFFAMVRCSHDMAEVEFVVNKIKDMLGKTINRRDGNQNPLTFKDFTVLSRRRLDGKKFAQALNAYGIPATFVGEANIFNSSTGRDLLAYLDIASNPTNSGMAIIRILKNSGISDQNIPIINAFFIVLSTHFKLICLENI